jgi:sarcosine oxidase subunit gamma
VADHETTAIGPTATGHFGVAGSGVVLAQATIAAAWNVQGDATRPSFAAEVRRQFDILLPGVPNTTATSGALTALWLGPASWLLVAGEDTAALTDFAAKRDALNAAAGAAFEVTASCAGWTIAGPLATTVLANGCPLDFHPRAFPEGTCAQSVLGHVNALFYKRDPSSFTLIVARSYARGVWRTLCQSAAQYGYDVLPPRRL